MYCLICETKSTKRVCQKCLWEFKKLNFLGCARCGTSKCFKDCYKLSQFSSISSLFLLQNLFANLLIAAKDLNDIYAQIIFEELFFAEWVNRIRATVIGHNIDTIVFAPLRLQRFAKAQTWHPITALYKYIHLSDFEIIKKNSIYLSTYSDKSKSTFLTTQSRLKKIQTNFDQFVIYSPENATNREPVKKILIIDDVLTTGTTAVRCQNSYAPILSKTSAEWHLQTLFRTPSRF